MKSPSPLQSVADTAHLVPGSSTMHSMLSLCFSCRASACRMEWTNWWCCTSGATISSSASRVPSATIESESSSALSPITSKSISSSRRFLYYCLYSSSSYFSSRRMGGRSLPVVVGPNLNCTLGSKSRTLSIQYSPPGTAPAFKRTGQVIQLVWPAAA